MVAAADCAIRLVRQHSNAPCVADHNFGCHPGGPIDPRSAVGGLAPPAVWVTGGCRGLFVLNEVEQQCGSTRSVNLTCALPPTPQQQPESRAADCALARSLTGKWLMLVGDSTQREIFAHAVRLLQHIGFHNATRLAPRVQGRSTEAPSNVESLYKEHYDDDVVVQGSSRCADGEVLLSLRFLRGLDLHKLERNARDWRERLLYVPWAMLRPSLPPLLLLATDSFRDHPASAAAFGSHGSGVPDLLVLHSCVWDLPSINRSANTYPHMLPEGPPPGYCTQPAPPHVMLPTRAGAGQARVVGSRCVRRASQGISDPTIRDDYRARLEAALALVRHSLRPQPSARVLFRSCHAGMPPLMSCLLTACAPLHAPQPPQPSPGRMHAAACG